MRKEGLCYVAPRPLILSCVGLDHNSEVLSCFKAWYRLPRQNPIYSRLVLLLFQTPLEVT